MEKETLLQKALKVPIKRKESLIITNEHIDLALAWLKGELVNRQIAIAMGKSADSAYSGNLLYSIAIWAREAFRKGRIIIK